VDQVTHGFGARQIEPPVTQRSVGELTRSRRARASLDGALDQLGQHRGTSVRPQLYGGFARERAACREEHREAVIERPPPAVDEVAEAGRASLGDRLAAGGLEQGRGDATGVGPAEADAADTATSRRRGDGDDGLAEIVHGAGLSAAGRPLLRRLGLEDPHALEVAAALRAGTQAAFLAYLDVH